MSDSTTSGTQKRRTVLKAAAAAGVLQVASPFIIKARGETPVKFGMDNPLTGTYAELGKNERIGAELAIEQINAKGGILGRPAQLIVEDSTSGDTGTAVQKAHKLISRDNVDFIMGNTNSAMSLAIGQVSHEAKKLCIITGGHTDAVTGTDCHWNVFRVCNTTRMETNAVSPVIKKFGTKWFFITSDYAFGHTLQQGFEASLKQYGGTVAGVASVPLGASDYSSYLIKAQAAKPDVILFLNAGDDAVNSIKQAAQFGLAKRFHIAGAQQELEVLEGLPPEARVGTWAFEWYWNQPNVPHVAEFVAAIKKKAGRVPTARHWFGYAATWTAALVANQEKTLDAVKLAKALEGFKLPPEVALMPDTPFYRKGDHQLMPNLYVGHAVEKGPQPEDLFHVDQVVKGSDVALPVAQTGCNMKWS